MQARFFGLVATWLALPAVAAALGACDGAGPVNPYGVGGEGGGGGLGGGGGTTVDPELGGPCVEDAQCDDGIGCTDDRCDKEVDRCRFHPVDEACDDAIYCDGIEQCDQKLGCVFGAPTSCDDLNVCTIDTCVEDDRSCRHDPRDADGDGDPDNHCGGMDCDDADPDVSSAVTEVCGNQQDDDCDMTVDEADCATPENDTCADALTISGDGSFALTTFGAAADYPTSCTPMGQVRDVVAAVIVPAGPPQDVVVRARTQNTPISVALAGQCGDAASELACGGSFSRPGGGSVAKLRARGVGGGASDVALPLYVTTVGGADVALDVSFQPASTAPSNETCGTAAAIDPGVPVDVEIIDAATDLVTACPSLTGELVYRLDLATVSDVDLYAVSLDGDGVPSISLRSSACALDSDEISCGSGLSTHVFRHSLPAGSYFVSVSGTAPTTVNVVAELSPPTPAPNDEDCESSAVLTPGVSQDLSFEDHQDDLHFPCFASGLDAAYGLTLDAPSDVLLVHRTSTGDVGAVELVDLPCGEDDQIVCAVGATSPLRVRKRNLAAGAYRVVSESQGGLPAQVTAFVRPYAPTQLVPFADGCADAVTIPATGGFFQGNTSNQTANFSAGCDSSGNGPFGAPDQLLRLVLPSQKRVVFDMTGSGYDTLLDIRKGGACPGTEVPLGCTAGLNGQKSFLDLTLDPGTYYVQIDGLGGATGPWSLDVHVVDP